MAAQADVPCAPVRSGLGEIRGLTFLKGSDDDSGHAINDMPVIFPPGLGEAGNEPGSHRVAGCDHDNRGRADCVLSYLSALAGAYRDDVRLKAQTWAG
jgi:hypothetical protein